MMHTLIMQFVLLICAASMVQFVASLCLSPELPQLACAEAPSDERPKKTAAKPPKASKLSSASQLQPAFTDSAFVSSN